MSAGTLAVIPVKPLAGALGRLGSVLAPAERAALQAAMLADVLGACRATPGLQGMLVVTGDPAATAIARGAGAAVPRRTSGSRSRTRASTSWDTARCGT